MIEAMQQNWQAVGASVHLNLMPLPQFINIFTFTHEFDVSEIGVGFNNDPDQSTLYGSGAAAPGGLNGGSFKNAEVDALLAQGASTVDRSKRRAIYGKLQDLMSDLVPIAPVFYPKEPLGINERVKGFDVGTYNTGLDAFRPWMNRVWVSD